ncbi:hypothetical protein BKA69DRAFT_318104 [Paraphysoderma sedebokerense]|nr:hypothetical protein BKA69DRAFT_318104 [Paraphysoderma sedebokerense]
MTTILRSLHWAFPSRSVYTGFGRFQYSTDSIQCNVVSSNQDKTQTLQSLLKHPNFEFSPNFGPRPDQFNPSDISYFPKIIGPDQLALLTSVLERKVKRLSYLPGHFDGVIWDYREISVSNGNWGKLKGQTQEHVKTEVEKILENVWKVLPAEKEWLPLHILDIDATGGIKAHVDNIEASGSIISGLTLLAPAPVTFRLISDPSQYFTLLTEPGSLYIQKDSVRYNFTHEIPGGQDDRIFRGQNLGGGRRISLLFRDKKC